MSGILAGLDNQILLEQQTYKLWESAGHKIVEAQLTADQIKQLFANIEQGATAAGGNRTMIGKGKDAAGAVSKAWEDLKNKVYNSGPMNNFAAAYDKQAEKLKQATGGDQGVFKYVQKYRDFAEKHPIIQGFVYSALIAAAGVTGAGLGGAAVLGLFKLTDQLLQGKDIRSAIYQGAKTGALAYGASKLGDLIRGKPDAAGAGDATSAAGDAASDTRDTAARAISTTGNPPPGMSDSFYQRWYINKYAQDPSNPSAMIMQQAKQYAATRAKEALATGADVASNVAASGIGAVRQQAGDIALKAVNDAIANGTDPSHVNTLKGIAQGAIDKFGSAAGGSISQTSIENIALNAAMKAGKQAGGMNESIELNEATIKILFSKVSLEHSKRIDEGIMDTLKGVAGKAMDYAKTKGHNLTTKVTADKLNTAWEKAGKPTDSDKIAEILKSSGVPENVVKDVFAKMKIPAPLPPVPPPDQPAAAPAQPVAAQQTPQPKAQPAASAAQQPAAQPAQKPGAVNKTPPKSNTPVAGTRSQKGAFAYNPLAEGDFEVNVPGFGTVPLEMLKRHVKELAKDFNDMIQSEEFIKAAYKAEQFYNALFALSKAMKAKSVEEGYRAGAVGGAGLGIDKAVKEEQAPMFTPEDKIAGLNDPRSDGWRVYKAVPAGTKESAIMKGLQTEGNVVTWSKDNPPPPELLLNTLIQILMKPENHKSPQDLISLWNDKYGLKHTLGSLRQYAQNDYKKMELSKALQKAALANESSER